jgi:hypothetical protein
VRDAQTSGKYVDVHCWVVTPRRFAELMERLVEVGLISFACADFVDTVAGPFEFYVALRPTADRGAALESWHRMAVTARDHLISAQAVPDGSAHQDASSLPPHQNAESDELAWLRGRVAAMEASTSWRLTAPIRALTTTLRMIGGRRQAQRIC